MSDENRDFSWQEKDAVVVRQQDAIAVYSNPDADLVIDADKHGTKMTMFGSWWRRRRFGPSSIQWKKS
jgi:hypothetical protein